MNKQSVMLQETYSENLNKLSCYFAFSKISGKRYGMLALWQKCHVKTKYKNSVGLWSILTKRIILL